MRTVTPRRRVLAARVMRQSAPLKEILMYIGGGILGTILLIVLIVYFIRRT